MPKRTTPLQATVHLVRQHTAEPGSKVTESVEFVDPRPGVGKREVDVVIEGTFNGDQVTTCVEVIEKGRKADGPWVEQQIAKHQVLPTNLLILVSKSGFTKPALAQIDAAGGRVRAVEPKAVEEGGQPVAFSLFMDRIDISPIRWSFEMDEPGGVTTATDVPREAWIFSSSGQVQGTVIELANEIANTPAIGQSLVKAAHDHPEREKVTHFTVVLRLNDFAYHLRKDDTGELVRILAIHLTGTLKFSQQEFVFTAAELDGRKYSSGAGEIFGLKAVWVATTDSSGLMTVSWRITDNRPLANPGAALQTLRFPELALTGEPSVVPPNDPLPQEAFRSGAV